MQDQNRSALSSRRCPLAPCLETRRFSPKQTSGPYGIEHIGIRDGIFDSRGGVPLDLWMRIGDLGTREPLEGMVVYIRHCDSGGLSSGLTLIDPDLTADIPPLVLADRASCTCRVCVRSPNPAGRGDAPGDPDDGLRTQRAEANPGARLPWWCRVHQVHSRT